MARARTTEEQAQRSAAARRGWATRRANRAYRAAPPQVRLPPATEVRTLNAAAEQVRRVLEAQRSRAANMWPREAVRIFCDASVRFAARFVAQFRTPSVFGLHVVSAEIQLRVNVRDYAPEILESGAFSHESLTAKPRDTIYLIGVYPCQVHEDCRITPEMGVECAMGRLPAREEDLAPGNAVVDRSALCLQLQPQPRDYIKRVEGAENLQGARIRTVTDYDGREHAYMTRGQPGGVRYTTQYTFATTKGLCHVWVERVSEHAEGCLSLRSTTVPEKTQPLTDFVVRPERGRPEHAQDGIVRIDSL